MSLTVDPCGFYQCYLEQKVRPDGRDLKQFREICLNTGCISTANGSALVKLGNTSVICGIKAELVSPPADEPRIGYIVPNLDLPALCSSRFKPGPPGELAQSLTQLVKDIIDSSGCILPKDLCVVPGMLSWCLFVDIICLSYDGNVVDASILAMMAALKNVVLPEVEVDENDKPLVNEEKKEPLKVYNILAATTCFYVSGQMMVDPTDEEENLAEVSVTTILQVEDGRICSLFKPGGLDLTAEQLDQCTDIAKTRAKSIAALIKT